MRIVVTGGAGFLGQYLGPLLKAEGHSVTVLDLAPPKAPITELESFADAVRFGVDITKPEQLAGAFAGVDAVIHLAGVISFWRKAADLLYRVNVDGTRNVLAECRRAEVPNFLHVSSVAAVGYNLQADDPIDESYRFPWSSVPTKHYMRSKHLAELEVESFAEASSRTSAVIVNPGLMWGPGDLTNSVKLLTRIAAGRVPPCPPGGTNIADVRDVAHGIVAALHRGTAGERYILGGENIAFRRVYDVIAKQLGAESPQKTLPAWTRGPLRRLVLMGEFLARREPALTSDNIDSSFRCRYFSSQKADAELSWRPEIPFEQTIADSIAWLERHGHLERNSAGADATVANSAVEARR